MQGVGATKSQINQEGAQAAHNKCLGDWWCRRTGGTWWVRWWPPADWMDWQCGHHSHCSLSPTGKHHTSSRRPHHRRCRRSGSAVALVTAAGLELVACTGSRPLVATSATARSSLPTLAAAGSANALTTRSMIKRGDAGSRADFGTGHGPAGSTKAAISFTGGPAARSRVAVDARTSRS